MAMNKLKIFDIILVILAIVYFLIIALVFTNKDNGFIICALFTLAAFIIQFVLIHYLNKRQHKKWSPFTDFPLDFWPPINNWPIYITANLYLFIQIMVSIILMALKVDLIASLIIQTVLLAIFIIIELALVQSIEYIEFINEKTEKQISFLENAKKEVTILLEIHNNNQLKDLYEIVRYANPMSTEEVFNLESEIINLLQKLRYELNNNNQENISSLINLLKNKFKEREVILRK